MDHFTPVASLLGGALIGISAVTLMLLNGRIAGISGIASGSLAFSTGVLDRGWRVAFVIGLIAAPLALSVIEGPPDISFVAPLPVMIPAGFLVGFGTVLGSGCTSGHGICGVARLSKRSIVATALFMAAGIMTAFVVRHVMAGG